MGEEFCRKPPHGKWRKVENQIIYWPAHPLNNAGISVCGSNVAGVSGIMVAVLQQIKFAVGRKVKVRRGIALLCILFFGCATVDQGARLDLLDFLQIGRTTRAEVLVKLGEPSSRFAQENILTYRIGGDTKKGYFVVWKNEAVPWAIARYSLVLEFGANNVLAQTNLVQVR